jgi:hypothetical protein
MYVLCQSYRRFQLNSTARRPDIALVHVKQDNTTIILFPPSSPIRHEALYIIPLCHIVSFSCHIFQYTTQIAVTE